MELSRLSIKCLANIPMLTDTMANAINELHNVLSPYYDEYWDFLEDNIYSKKRKGFKLKEEDTGSISIYNETFPLERVNEIYFAISFYQEIKTNPKSFLFTFGYYLMDETQSAIYFQLFENSETTFIDELLQSKDFIKSKSLSQEYQYNNSGEEEEEKSVWVEFTVDETLSFNKIKTCSELFKTTILMPILNKLK